MRIGIFDPYLDDLGGGEKYMMSIASCLSNKYSVTVFWDNKKDLKDLQERFLLDLSKVNLANNIFSKTTSVLKRLLITREFDVIIFLSDGSIPLCLSKKLFIHIQQPLDVPTNSIMAKLKLSRVNALFYNSNYTKSFIDKSVNAKSFILYPPVELFPEAKKKENIILHVGRFRVKNVLIGDYKKQGFMIEEYKKMVKSGLKNWKFILAVSVNDKDLLMFEKLHQAAKGFSVEFLVNKNNKELWDIYNRSKIYWHASGYGENLETHPEYAEHFGISTVEAMGAGAVPVVINAGGQREIIEDNINGFLWDTKTELQEKTMELIKNEKLWEKMSISAKKRAEFFAGDRFCKEISELIEK